MILEFRGGRIEATPENSAIFIGKTLLNGMYVDLDDDYLFLPADPEVIECYEELKVQAAQEGIPVYELDSYDPESPPFCFCINALCRVFREEVEWLTSEHKDE
jgi:hypothetical protein